MEWTHVGRKLLEVDWNAAAGEKDAGNECTCDF